MDTEPVDIAEFLTARCDETAKRWQRIWRARQGDKRIDGGWDGWGELGRLVSACIDTTRGGREVAAMRKRLALYVEARETMNRLYMAERHDETEPDHAEAVHKAGARLIALADAVKLDAMVFADHNDFDERWRIDD